MTPWLRRLFGFKKKLNTDKVFKAWYAVDMEFEECEICCPGIDGLCVKRTPRFELVPAWTKEEEEAYLNGIRFRGLS
jgi:hypothetical protein